MGVQHVSFPSQSSKVFLAHASICALIALPMPAAQAQNASVGAPKQDTHGIIVANMDASVRPGDDFNEYTNGGWIKRTEIPADRPNVGVFTALADLSSKRTAGLIEEAARGNAPAGSNIRKIADLYKDVWGHLPETLRQEMNQYSREQFMAKYNDLLKQYYSRIAEKGRQKKDGS